MEKINKKIANMVVFAARKSVKDDINSTGSTWLFQPKIPANAKKLKEMKK